MKNEALLRASFFVLRCSLAGTMGYLAATALGLPHPVWACMSALIVSQEKLTDTRASLTARVAGSLIGVAVAIAIHYVTSPLTLEPAVPLAAGIAICAIIARGRPGLRVCMWTCAIVLLTAGEADVPHTAFYRGSEVLMGAVIGGLLHTVSAFTVNRLILPRLSR